MKKKLFSGLIRTPGTEREKARHYTSYLHQRRLWRCRKNVGRPVNVPIISNFFIMQRYKIQTLKQRRPWLSVSLPLSLIFTRKQKLHIPVIQRIFLPSRPSKFQNCPLTLSAFTAEFSISSAGNRLIIYGTGSIYFYKKVPRLDSFAYHLM